MFSVLLMACTVYYIALVSNLAPLELCTILPALVDENGCLRKGNKSIPANRFGLKQISAPAPDIVIWSRCFVTMFGHVAGTPLTSVEIRRLSCYCAVLV